MEHPKWAEAPAEALDMPVAYRMRVSLRAGKKEYHSAEYPAFALSYGSTSLPRVSYAVLAWSIASRR